MGSKNIARLITRMGIEKDPLPLLATDTLFILPAADDTGTFAFGDGTTDMDVQIFLGASTDFVLFDVGNGQVTIDSAELNLGDSDELEFGDAADVTIAWDGTDLDVLAAADDSVFKFGNGTNSFDVWIYGNAAADYLLWDASVSKMTPQGAAFVAQKVTALTANTTLNATHFGGILTNRGASAEVVATLPAPTAALNGAWIQYLGVAGQNMLFSTATVDTLIAFNDATADTVAFNTANQLIGASAVLFCDGTSWIATNTSQATLTIAT